MSLKRWFVDDGTFLGATRNALPTLILMTGLMMFVELAGWLDWLQNYALDRVLQFNWSRQSDRVVLIAIGDQDYESPDVFNSTSPLDPKKVLEAIDFIAAARPAVLGVDLDTSDKRYAAARFNLQGTRVVWGRSASAVKEQRAPSWPPWHHPSLQVVPKPFLGGNYTNEIRGDEKVTVPRSGVALMPADSDHVVRSYQRTFEVTGDHGASDKIDSLPWAIVKQYCEYCVDNPNEPRCISLERAKTILAAAEKSEGEEHRQVFNFSYNPGRFRQIAFSNFVKQNREKLWPTSGSPLEGRVVILGGQFEQARDMHFTSVGERFGLEMIAEAVDGELEHRFISHLAIWAAAALEFVAGLALVWVHWWLHKPWAVYAMAVLIFVLSVICSYIAFQTAAYWFNFTAVFVGLWIHMLWDGAQAGRRAQRQLAMQGLGGHA